MEVALLLTLDSARFEFTLKMRLNRKMLKRPNVISGSQKLLAQALKVMRQ